MLFHQATSLALLYCGLKRKSCDLISPSSQELAQYTQTLWTHKENMISLFFYKVYCGRKVQIKLCL